MAVGADERIAEDIDLGLAAGGFFFVREVDADVVVDQGGLSDVDLG